MPPRHPVAVPRAEAQRVLSEDRGRRGTAMRGLDHRQHARRPAFLVQARAEVDVFVVGEEAFVEEAFADGGAAVEGGGGGDAPGWVARLPGCWVAAVTQRLSNR